MGGVDEGLSRGASLYEETDLCLRIQQAGYRVSFNGQARLTHLVAPGGGCRVDRVVEYVGAFAHNRGVMIRRHGRWYHAARRPRTTGGPRPVLRARLPGPSTLVAGCAGAVRGLRDGGQPPVCTSQPGGPQRIFRNLID